MTNLLKKISRWCNKYEWIILLLVLVILLRLPSLVAPHHYGDEEIYFVMGRAWRMGLGMYSAAFDHKPPLIYILAGIAQSMFAFRAILLGWMLFHTYVFWLLAQKIWGEVRPKMAYISSLLFVILTSLPTLEGNIANAELFMMMPLSVSLLILLNTKDREYFKYLIAGLIAGIGLLFKVPVLFDLIAIALYFFVYAKDSLWKGIKSLVNPRLWLLIVGFLMPIILTVVYYQLKGVGADYIRAAITVNFGYVSSWKTSSFTFNPLQSGLVIRGMYLVGYSLVLYILRKKLSPKFVLVALWFGFSLFGALLSARPYPHYLLQPVVPVVLLLPFIFVLEKLVEWIMMGVVIVSLILAQNHVMFGAYPTLPVYTNYLKYITGKLGEVDYRNTFDGTKMNYAIAAYLGERMVPDDKIFVWSNDTTLYNLLDRPLTGGKYMVNFHIRDWRAFDLVMENLNQNRPEYIVVLPNPMDFPELFALLETKYYRINTIENADIYRIKSK